MTTADVGVTELKWNIDLDAKLAPEDRTLSLGEGAGDDEGDLGPSAGLDLGIEDLQDDNLEEIHGDLERFQKDKIVNEALSSGVDLRQYARKVDADLSVLTAASVSEYEEESAVSSSLLLPSSVLLAHSAPP